MQERGLSSSKLAREIHVHTSTVSNWLDGKDVKTENLAALCEYFGCSLDYLADSTAETKKTPTSEGGHEIDDRKMKAAFLGGLANGLSDEQIDGYWEDARNYIGYKIQQEKKKNRKPN